MPSSLLPPESDSPKRSQQQHDGRLPIVSMMCAGGEGAAVLIPALGATLAGSVYGDPWDSPRWPP